MLYEQTFVFGVNGCGNALDPMEIGVWQRVQRFFDHCVYVSVCVCVRERRQDWGDEKTTDLEVLLLYE